MQVDQKEIKVRRRKLTEYISDPRNANAGSERGLDMLERSLQEDGVGRSIVADKFDQIPAGNKTMEAAINAGIEDVIEIEDDGHSIIIHKRSDWDLNDPQGSARRYAYRDNRTSEISLHWDAEIMLEDQNHGFDFTPFFSEIELKNIMNTIEGESNETDFYKPPQHDNTEVEQMQAKWQVKTGDVWIVESAKTPGHEHRLLCGDSRRDLPQLMQGRKAALVVTSPPYCVDKDYEENMTVEEWQQLLTDVFSAVKPFCSTFFINLANRRHFNDGFEIHTFGKLVTLLEAIGVPLIALRIWAKNITWLQAHPYWRHTYKPVDEYEFLALFGDKLKHKKRLTEEEATDWGYRGIWTMGSVASNKLQSARYPVQLPSRAMRLLTDFGDIVLDPFSGSGTTTKAGEDLGRIVYACEQRPEDVALSLEELTEELGLGVHLEST